MVGEVEAGEYRAALGETEYTGFAEAFRTLPAPGEGAEVFAPTAGRATFFRRLRREVLREGRERATG